MFTSPLATKRRWHSPSLPDQMPVIDRETPSAREGQLEGDLEELTTPELLRSAQPELRDSQVDSMGSFPAAQADLRDSQMSAGDSMGSFPAAHPDLRDSQMNSPGSSAEQMPSQMVSHAEEPPPKRANRLGWLSSRAFHLQTTITPAAVYDLDAHDDGAADAQILGGLDHLAGRAVRLGPMGVPQY